LTPSIQDIAIDSQGNVTVFSGIAFGTYTINYRICEAINLSNCKEATITIVVSDTTPPTWITNPLPVDISVSCDAIPDAPVLLATDSCGSATVVNNLDVIVAGTCAGDYTITRTWTATDLSGITTPHTQTITVTDTTAPVFTGTLPFDVTVDCASIPVANILMANDNCSTTPLTAILTETITPALPTECPIKSRIRREWNVSDACGNAATPLVQIITVQDLLAPTIDSTYPATLTATCDAIPPVVQPTITDNCATVGNGLVVTQLADVPSITAPNGIYTITRTWEATDGCNTKTFTQVVTITIPNYIQQAPQLYANCNIDNSLKYDLLKEIQKTYPAIFTNGTFNDVDELGASFDAANGTFEPYNVAIGDYKIEYTNNDPLCPSKVIFEIRVDDDCTVENCQTLDVHNALTPNGDMDNETLVFDGITSECYKNNLLEIYNRWGVLIYEKENYDNLNNPFTGMSDGRSTIKKGELLPTGTYFYFIKFRSTIGDIEPKSGFIYLTRD
jgi:gliding motility-associated-like protein